ncbi:MAG: efflux RND transporter periplasmic adaptor subunit [Halieaceae bacterium]|jgi:membrane fusion protein (multidrug efflux system)|nr:efflux RND transporter periplasmic adaptor subunit [Halieaceae bacterium]
MINLLRGVMIALVTVACLGCAEEEAAKAPPQVVVQPVFTQQYRPKFTFVGRLEARDDVRITARVTGYIEEIAFREGENVAAGDLLYRLDDSELKATLAGARASLASAKAAYANAERNFRRGQELLPQGAISQAEMDSLQSKMLDAEAGVSSAEAKVASAEANLGFATIQAPISGRIARSMQSVGDLVGPQSGPLTTLVSIDPIEALFSISEATYIAKSRDAATEAGGLPKIEVNLSLSDGSEYPETGLIDYFGNRVDIDTGTIEGRAVIPNPDGLLVPGQYVNVTLMNPVEIPAVFAPQSAVQVDQQGSFLLSVDSSGVVARHNVELGERVGDYVLVKQGVDAGTQVITRGLQMVRPGLQVQVKALNPEPGLNGTD